MSNETQEDQLIPPGCGLWLGWVLASIFGALIGWLLGWRLSFLAPGNLSTAVLGATFGLCLGMLQWLVLRGHLKATGLWILASIVGWGAGLPAGAFLAQQFGLAEAMFGLVVGLCAGALLGIVQWIYLRSRVTRAGWWIPASIFAWGSSLVFYMPGASWLGLLYGALSGLVTGTVLLWLVYRPVPDETRENVPQDTQTGIE